MKVFLVAFRDFYICFLTFKIQFLFWGHNWNSAVCKRTLIFKLQKSAEIKGSKWRAELENVAFALNEKLRTNLHFEHFGCLRCLLKFYTIQIILWLLLKFKENVKQTHAWTETGLGTWEKVKRKSKHTKKTSERKCFDPGVMGFILVKWPEIASVNTTFN